MSTGPLQALAAELRAEDTIVSAHVVDPGQAEPVHGRLAAAGPRAVGSEPTYALLVESIREGYLLHYGTSRLLATDDPDLDLLAGDYLFARGLEQLAALGDLDAIRELSDLIALSAQLHAPGTTADPDAAPALWLASAVAVAVGPTPAHDAAKQQLRGGDPKAPESLLRSAHAAAAAAGIGEQMRVASESVGSPPSHRA